MHLFKINADGCVYAMVVAHDVEDATSVYREQTEDESNLVVVQLPDEQSTKIRDDNGYPMYRTAAEWTALGRGVIASTEA